MQRPDKHQPLKVHEPQSDSRVIDIRDLRAKRRRAEASSRRRPRKLRLRLVIGSCLALVLFVGYLFFSFT